LLLDDTKKTNGKNDSRHPLSTCRSHSAISALEEAETTVISALESAGAAFRALATAESSRAKSFDSHAESFLRDLARAQSLILEQISSLGPDLPFENSTMQSLVGADISAKQTIFAHRAVARALRVVSEVPLPEDSAHLPNFDNTNEVMQDIQISPKLEDMDASM
jgi:hypothetical protein